MELVRGDVKTQVVAIATICDCTVKALYFEAHIIPIPFYFEFTIHSNGFQIVKFYTL